jgi:pyruvate/2-oxoglutarate dehydrogenase complex dihydrolipoamide dehydrogenase (E3) component
MSLSRPNLIRVDGHSGGEVGIQTETPAGPNTITATHVLVATGRIPNTTEIGLDVAGVQLAPGGWIRVNDRLETTAADIWAIGECAGSPQFATISRAAIAARADA